MWVAASKLVLSEAEGSPIFAHSVKRFTAIQVREFVSNA